MVAQYCPPVLGGVPAGGGGLKIKVCIQYVGTRHCRVRSAVRLKKRNSLV